jgi:hypothetical protein
MLAAGSHSLGLLRHRLGGTGSSSGACKRAAHTQQTKHGLGQSACSCALHAYLCTLLTMTFSGTCLYVHLDLPDNWLQQV